MSKREKASKRLSRRKEDLPGTLMKKKEQQVKKRDLSLSLSLRNFVKERERLRERKKALFKIKKRRVESK